MLHLTQILNKNKLLNMDKFVFEALATIRTNTLKYIASLSEKQLFTIPSGFNNNIVWQLGHMVTTQQLLCYHLSNNSLLIPQEYVSLFRKGTSPNDRMTQINVEEIRHYFFETTLQFMPDYNAGKLNEFTKYPTSMGVELTTIEDAITFNFGHENLHFGVIMAMTKVV